MTHEEFMKIVRDTNERNRHPELWTEAERLCKRIMSPNKSKEECFQLENEVKEFFASAAPEEEKKMLRGYTEALAMVCSSFREEKTDL